MTKLLTFTGLYPNAAQPRHGIFVENRLRRIVAVEDFSAEVIAPVPWVPPGLRHTPKYAALAQAPEQETRFDIPVHHPRWVSIPKIGMGLAPLFLSSGARATIARLMSGSGDSDLIDAHYFYPDGVAAARLARRFDVPLVITARGSDINLIAHFPGPRRKIVAAAIQADAVVAVSAALAQRMVDIGIPENKIAVLPNGVDLELFAPPVADAPVFDPATTRPFILSVGNIVPEKGQKQLIEAMASVPDHDLVLIGDGPMRAECEALVAERGLQDRVHFKGVIAQSDLPPWYGAAEMTVLASAREGMPNVVLESLACGTAVVATNVGGVPEIMTAAETGRVIGDHRSGTLAAAILDLIKSPSARAAIRQHAEKFSWDKTIEAQRALYTRILSSASA